MQSQVQTIDPVTVELKIEMPWDRVQKGLDLNYGKLQKTAKVRGFRPGKVPRGVVQKLFGRQVRNEVVSELIEQGVFEAIKKHDIAIVAPPRVDSMPSISEGQPLTFTAKIEVRPTVESVDTSGIELTRPAADVKDEAINEEIERLRERHAAITTPDPMRPSQAGDLLTLDYRVEVDGKERSEMAASERTVELGGDRLLPALDEGLRGLLPDQEKTIAISYGDDSANEELRGKTAQFHVKVREVREKHLPELDDEFAKDVGEHETLDALKAKIRGDLTKQAEQRAQSGLREQVIEKLVDKNPIPVPPSLVAQQEQAMRQELAKFMRMLGQTGLGEDMMDLHQQAEKKVRAAILLGEIARLRELKVAPEEVDARLAEIAEQTGKHIAKVRVEYGGEKRDSLESKMLEDKLLEYLLSQATVTDAPADQEPAKESP